VVGDEIIRAKSKDVMMVLFLALRGEHSSGGGEQWRHQDWFLELFAGPSLEDAEQENFQNKSY
jgi:hypothetical protein